MTPFPQLYAHKPELGLYGDCYRTAVACLVDCHPADVPHVMMPGRGGTAAMRAWLATRGKLLITAEIYGETPDDAMRELATWAPGTAHILIGRSRARHGHAVICRDGAIVHDPSGNGIVAGFDDPMYGAHFVADKLTPIRRRGRPRNGVFS